MQSHEDAPAAAPRQFALLRRLARRPYRRMRRAAHPERLSGARRTVSSDGVALTFDDGPHPVYTHAVLDALAAEEVRATFFVVGRNARRHPEVIGRMIDEGHAIASHSMTHPDPWLLTPRALWQDYRTGHLEVSTVVGRDVRLFRPPPGPPPSSGLPGSVPTCGR